jgi:precorrin-6B methylase 2
MIRLLSYIYPITKKIESRFNGTLEITWFQGKKLLNTKNANYSYGSLEKILSVGFKEIDVNKFQNILLLGLGGGNVVKTLHQKFNYKNNITAIEIDPVIIQVAEDEFGITQTDNLTIICTDAYDFVMNSKMDFDFIIIDLFLDDTIPEKFFNNEFWNRLIGANQLLFNASLHKKNEHLLRNIIDLLENNDFIINKLDNVNKTNTLLIAKKNML